MSKPKKTFEEWLKEVDREVKAVVGMSYQDLEDCPYSDWYESGKSAKSAAKKAIKNAGGEMLF